MKSPIKVESVTIGRVIDYKQKNPNDMGRAMAPAAYDTLKTQNDNTYNVSVVFDILTHYTLELNTKQDEYSRSGAIVAALIEALNGVNMTGVGTFSMSKRVHPDCGTNPLSDGKENVGTELVMGLEMATTVNNTLNDIENMVYIDKVNKIRLA